jgi:hypothetical protein
MIYPEPTGIIKPKSWDALPPVFFDGGQFYSTRVLEHQYRKLEDENNLLKSTIKRYQKARNAMDKFNANRDSFNGSIIERNQRNRELYEELLAARTALMEVE